MTEFEFTVVIPEVSMDSVGIEVEKLYEAGCDDATIMWKDGDLCVDFCREASSEQEAKLSGLADVQKVLPSAYLVTS